MPSSRSIGVVSFSGGGVCWVIDFGRLLLSEVDKLDMLFCNWLLLFNEKSIVDQMNLLELESAFVDQCNLKWTQPLLSLYMLDFSYFCYEYLALDYQLDEFMDVWCGFWFIS